MSCFITNNRWVHTRDWNSIELLFWNVAYSTCHGMQHIRRSNVSVCSHCLRSPCDIHTEKYTTVCNIFCMNCSDIKDTILQEKVTLTNDQTGCFPCEAVQKTFLRKRQARHKGRTIRLASTTLTRKLPHGSMLNGATYIAKVSRKFTGALCKKKTTGRGGVDSVKKADILTLKAVPLFPFPQSV